MKRIRLREIETSYRIRNVTLRERIFTKPEDVSAVFAELFPCTDVEHVVIFLLSAKKSLIAFHVVSKGTVSESIIHPREIFKTAIINSASSIIMAHNHPSEHLVPSEEDIKVTRRVHEAGKLIGIGLIDSIIVNARTAEVCSLFREGHIND